MILVKPYDDELLLSWLYRLSRANYTNISTLINSLFKNKKLYLSDLDIYKFSDTDKEKIEKLSFSIKLESLQLLNLNGYLEENIFLRGRHRWITPRQISKDFNKNFFAIRICPLCISEKVYIKKIWRLMIVNICPLHNCYLINYCENCGHEISYVINDYTIRLYQCAYCKTDLRKVKLKFAKTTSSHLKSQKKLLNILEKGYYKLNNRYYYSVGLFYLLRLIVKNIMRIKCNQKIFIEQLTPQQLSYLVSISLILLEKFPYRLNRFYKKHKLTNLHAILDRYKNQAKHIPYWYMSNINYNTRI